MLIKEMVKKVIISETTLDCIDADISHKFGFEWHNSENIDIAVDVSGQWRATH